MKQISKNIYFIAEIGVNHEANLKKAFKCIKLAKEGGASAVKFQCYKAEKIASKFANSYWDKNQEREKAACSSIFVTYLMWILTTSWIASLERNSLALSIAS